MSDHMNGDDDTIVEIKIKMVGSEASSLPVVKLKGSVKELTVRDLKKGVEDVCGVSPKRLIFSGRILNVDSETLGQAMLSSGLTVHVQPELKKNVPQATHSAGSATPALGAVATPQPPPGILIALGVLSVQPMHAVHEAITTLFRICDKIVQVPSEPRYRTIRRQNRSFVEKVKDVPGGENVMREIGFVVQGDSWTLVPNASAWNVLVSSRDVLKTAINVIDEAATSDLENEEKDEVQRKALVSWLSTTDGFQATFSSVLATELIRQQQQQQQQELSHSQGYREAAAASTGEETKTEEELIADAIARSMEE
eukprot:367366_1